MGGTGGIGGDVSLLSSAGGASVALGLNVSGGNGGGAGADGGFGAGAFGPGGDAGSITVSAVGDISATGNVTAAGGLGGDLLTRAAGGSIALASSAGSVTAQSDAFAFNTAHAATFFNWFPATPGMAMNVTQAMVAAFDAPVVMIGSELVNGALTVIEPISFPELSLATSGSLAQSPGALLTAIHLAATGGSVQLAGANSVTHLQGMATSGDFFFNNAGALDIGAAGISATGGITIVSGGTLTLSGMLSASNPLNALVLSGQGFVNNAGAAALSAPNGRWLVYSANPATDAPNLGGLAYDFKQYNAPYAVTAAQTTGNGLLYSAAPVLTPAFVSTAEISRTYDGTATATVTPSHFSVGPVVNGDNVVVSGATSGLYDNRNVGSGKLVTLSGLQVSATDVLGRPVYGYQLSAPTLSGNVGVITPAALTVTAAGETRVYNGNTTSTLAPMVTGTVFLGDSLTGLTQSFDSKNAGSRTLSVNPGFTLSDGNGGNNYSVSFVAATGSITPAPLVLSGLGSGSKIYDGTLTASFGGALSGVLPSDSVGVTLTGQFLDGNAGSNKPVTLSSATLFGADAVNYSLAFSPVNFLADIAPRPLSTWVGSAGGDWSNGINWDQGVVPVGANVLQVSLPGAASHGVIYDAAAGNTMLKTLNGSQSLVLKGGQLTLGVVPGDLSTLGGGATLEVQAGGNLVLIGQLNAGNFVQSGGAVTGNGSLQVGNSYTQTGGSIALGAGGSAAIFQNTGNLVIGSLTAPSVMLAAPAGAVGQTGPLVAQSVSVNAATGIQLDDPGNQISSFAASNSGGGDIVLFNTGALVITGNFENSGGSILVDNTGALSTTGLVSAPGSVFLTARSPLTIGSGGITAGGNVALVAGATPGAGDDLMLSGPVNSAGAIALVAGDNLVQNADVTTSGGSISALALTGDITMLSGTTSSNGGTIGYDAQAGNIVLTTLDAGSGSIDLFAAGNVQSAPGFTGSNLRAASAFIQIGGSATFSTAVQRLDVTVEGPFTITDTITGTVFAPAPAAPPEQVVQQTGTTQQTVLVDVLQSTNDTSGSTTPSGSQEDTGKPSGPAVGPLASLGRPEDKGNPIVTNVGGTIGGGTDEFGGGESGDGTGGKPKPKPGAQEEKKEEQRAISKAPVCR